MKQCTHRAVHKLTPCRTRKSDYLLLDKHRLNGHFSHRVTAGRAAGTANPSFLFE